MPLRAAPSAMPPPGSPSVAAPARMKIKPLPGPVDGLAAALDRAGDARLARVHLRGGLLPLARAALEQMAGAGTLDAQAMADLAEVRWRSGDTEGAGDAARAHQASGGDEPLALLIAAEDLARRGELQQASRQAHLVFDRVGGSVDILFAGQPRSPIWPVADVGWMDAEASAAGSWGLLVGGSEVVAPTPETWRPAPLRQPEPEPAPIATTLAVAPLPSGRGGLQQPGGQKSTSAMLITGRLAGVELETVDHALAQGQIVAATERLGVLLRLDPALAPIILSAADRAAASAAPGSSGLSAIHLVRGDAYRILGRETEAGAAYQLAHQTLLPGSTTEGTT